MLRNIYFGWFIVAAGLIIISLDGILLYSFGISVPYLEESFHASHLEISSLITIRNIFFAFSMIIAGRLIDKYNPKYVIFIGGLTAVIGIFLTAYAENLWQLRLYYAVLPGIGNGFFYIPSLAIISRWFNEKRALAIGIATLGVPISGMIINPLHAWLISTVGLESSLVVLSLIIFFLLLFAFVMRKAPESENSTGINALSTPTDSENNNSMGVMEAIRTKSFWTLYIIFFLGMNTFLIILINLFDYGIESGIDPLTASGAPAALAFGSIFGRLFFSGVLTKYLNNKQVLFTSYFLEALSIIIIIYFQTVWAFYLFGFLFGFFYSGHMPIFPTILSNYFGTKNIGSIMGVSATGFSLASITGPLLAGYLYDISGTHSTDIIVAAAICFVTAATTFLITTPKKEEAVN
jgi:OFA family oxalate/formate antiporter-like MFS transporter